jgi:hypothetical protein
MPFPLITPELVARIERFQIRGVGGALFTPPRQNFERVGLRLVPMGIGWQDGCR